MQDSDNRAAYDYGRTRSGSVFGPAAVAALVALLLMWGAWIALQDATESDRLAEPPDLKGVVEAIEDGGRDAVRAVKSEEALAAESEPAQPIAGSR